MDCFAFIWDCGMGVLVNAALEFLRGGIRLIVCSAGLNMHYSHILCHPECHGISETSACWAAQVHAWTLLVSQIRLFPFNLHSELTQLA